ncbi:hypothetical protein LB507_001275 [Fusarium sp. FIESC RH6]|nr:hypothetical protein LB507_001275 [Fusarium sp. FIESC RH6]
MNSLKSFSLKHQHRLHNRWTTNSTLSVLLNSLPVSCTGLELEGILQDGSNATHVCEDLRRLLPRMEYVHIDLEPLCDAMLGTWDADESYHPISLPQIRSLHITCAGESGSGKRGCVDRHQRAQPLTVGHSMVKALQQVVELPETASAEFTVLGTSPSGGDDNKALCETRLRCHIRKDAKGVKTETWTFPITWLVGDIRSPAWYIRMRPEAYVVRDRDDLIVVAGGRPWQTLSTGARLPKAFTLGKKLKPDEDIFNYEDWTERYPKKKPMLVMNERKAGMPLVDAELHEGYEERSLMEHTPAGFVRYGGPAWGYWRLYAEDDEPPEDWNHDLLRGPVG